MFLIFPVYFVFLSLQYRDFSFQTMIFLRYFIECRFKLQGLAVESFFVVLDTFGEKSWEIVIIGSDIE
jgi:hypothetical protein